jgi:hypothetical protein
LTAQYQPSLFWLSLMTKYLEDVVFRRQIQSGVCPLYGTDDLHLH